MSRLSEMIKKLCPNGVEYKRFDEVCSYVRGVTYNKSQEIHGTEDGWKVLRANNITLATNSLNFDDVKVISKAVKVKSEQLLKKGDILICAGSGSKEHVGKVAYISEDSDYSFGGFMAVVRALDNIINSRYLYHLLTSSLFINYLKSALNSTTINNLSSSVIGPFLIPLPPLEIQCEIVQILDNFANLTAELTAELAKRKKQYEHYRDMLLNFEGGGRYDNVSSKIEWKKLGEICEVKTGGEPPADAIKGKMPFGDSIYPIYANGIGDNALWGFAKEATINKEAVTFSSIGTIGHPTIRKAGFTPIIRLKVIYPKDEQVLSLSFLKYVLEVIDFKQQKSSLPNVNASMIKAIDIPLPPLAEQKRIVAILDRFDALCNSLSEGLPAEIELRRKQYEYYRDKLLSFKEAG